MKKLISDHFKALADLMLPRVCIVCGRKLLINERHLCLHCYADMPFTHFWERSHNPMADRFNELIQESPGLVTPEHYAYCCSLFFYDHDANYRMILYNLKYRSNLEAGEHFGGMLGKRIAGSEHLRDVDCVIPVPLHWRRRWKRGYNQAEVIASAMAEAIGVPMRADVLKRKRYTKTQTRLDVEAKSANVSGAFEVCRYDLGDARHLLVVDDLFTTGSTLMACFAALRKAFPYPVRISVATLGFVGRI